MSWPAGISRTRAEMWTASAWPTATEESKITISTSGRSRTLREWCASGDETQ